MPEITKRTTATEVSLFCRRCLCVVILTLCALVLAHTLVIDAFHIPSGSMAPALHGHHRVCNCPRCGFEVAVAQPPENRADDPRYFRNAFCSNCGFHPLPTDESRDKPGDKILVNKAAYLVRKPSRWEIVVFRLLGTFYIKRLLGLPGEEIRIHAGDLHVNGKLARKTFAEARAMRVLVFDQTHAPAGSGWKDRWECSAPALSAPQGELRADGRMSARTLTYRHYLLDAGKCEPIRDEYAYNASLRADSECVHDFLMETELEVSDRHGTISLRLSDGHDWVEVLLPVGTNQSIEAFAWPIDGPAQMRKLAESDTKRALQAGRRQRVEMAFVDRRVSLAVDGHVWLSADLPEAKHRQGVVRPFQVQADGVMATLHGFRLYRDVHYGQQGRNAVHGKAVRLGADQYFMLGDNSPNSEDSRFWPDEGRVHGDCLIGPMLHATKRLMIAP